MGRQLAGAGNIGIDEQAGDPNVTRDQSDFAVVLRLDRWLPAWRAQNTNSIAVRTCRWRPAGRSWPNGEYIAVGGLDQDTTSGVNGRGRSTTRANALVAS